MGDQPASRWSVLATALASLKGHSTDPKAITLVLDKKEKAEIYLSAESVEAQACKLLGRLTSADHHGWIELLAELILSPDEWAIPLYAAFKKASPFHGKVLLLRTDIDGHDAVLGDLDEAFDMLKRPAMRVTTWPLSVGDLGIYERAEPLSDAKDKKGPSRP